MNIKVPSISEVSSMFKDRDYLSVSILVLACVSLFLYIFINEQKLWMFGGLLFIVLYVTRGYKVYRKEERESIDNRIIDKRNLNRERAIKEGKNECYKIACDAVLLIATGINTSIEINRDDMKRGLPKWCHSEINIILEQLVGDGYLEKRGIKYFLVKSKLDGFIGSDPYEPTGDY